MKNPIEQAKKHAIEAFPEESCGWIIRDEYIPSKNIADDPVNHKEGDNTCGCRLCMFRVDKKDVAKYLPKADMLIHSHPNGPLWPSQCDMASQMKMGLPWGIIPVEEGRAGDPEIWGDTLPIPELLGRTFMHGIRDCYSIIRDTFRMGKERLAMDGITKNWPFDPIYLADCPRDDAWWEGDDDLYTTNPIKWGFVDVKFEDIKPGDVFLTSIRSEKLNHGGLLISNDLIMHHLPQRVSRREPSAIWGRQAKKWVRYVGEGSIYEA